MKLQILDPKTKKNNRARLEELIKTLEDIKGTNSFNPDTFDPTKIRERFKHLSENSVPGDLFNSLCTIKDLVSNTDGFVSGGSEFLRKYKPPYNATVYTALKTAGVINVANSNLDEFGMGGSGLEGCFGPVPNPIDPEYIVGGSSSGGAYLVSRGLVDFTLASDTGDSARYPASNSNIFGFKPSYGAVSRYGFYPFCSGFDCPSIMATSIRKIAEVLSKISFEDPRDLNTLGNKERNYTLSLAEKPNPNLKIAVIRETFWNSQGRSQESFEIEKEFEKLLVRIREELGIRVDVYDFPQEILRLANLVYIIVSYSESISNHSNLTGLMFPFEEKGGELKFSKRESGNNYPETLEKNRSVFGNEFVFRQIMGMHFLEGENYRNIYLKCKKLLSRINEEVEILFKRYDLILSPTADSPPPKIKEYKRSYSPSNISNILLLANFCSLPAISIPWISMKGIPIGLHLMAGFREDETLLNVSNHIFNLINKKGE